MAKPITHVQVVPKRWAKLLLPPFMRRTAYFRRQRDGKWWLYRINVGAVRYLGRSQDVRFVYLRDLFRYDMIRYRGGNARTKVVD
jgi:hypothetical protein